MIAPRLQAAFAPPPSARDGGLAPSRSASAPSRPGSRAPRPGSPGGGWGPASPTRSTSSRHRGRGRHADSAAVRLSRRASSHRGEGRASRQPQATRGPASGMDPLRRRLPPGRRPGTARTRPAQCGSGGADRGATPTRSIARWARRPRGETGLATPPEMWAEMRAKLGAGSGLPSTAPAGLVVWR